MSRINTVTMIEEFLHYLWRFRLLDPKLETVAGEPVTVIQPGEHNRDAGPDFINARVRIGSTTWAGNVEIHVQASDWYRHGHQEDPAYENVVLHVVMNNDLKGKERELLKIPQVEIRDRFPLSIYERYEYFLNNHQRIPCENLIRGLDPFVFGHWADALVSERLEGKCLRFRRSLESSRFDWDETFYRQLAYAFGFRINSLAFEQLARSLPYRLLLRHQGNLFQLEALVFGQAGLLDQAFTGEYPRLLSQEYHFLRQKYSLTPVNPTLWKFLRLRPSNFPTLRLAQFAGLLHRTGKLLDTFLQADNAATLAEMLMVQASEYWNDHYIFDRDSPHRHKLLGLSSVHLLILNLVAPFLFYYGEEKGIEPYKEKGLQLLGELPGENNSVIALFRELGLPVSQASQTQALIQMKSRYCDRKKCLECRIGKALLS